MGVLVLKILAPFLAHGLAASSARRDKSIWEAVFVTKTVVVPVVIAAALVVEHHQQATAAKVVQEAAAEAQQTRLRLEAAAAEGQQARQRLEASAAEAQLARQRIEAASQDVVDLMRERYPHLTEQEALDRVDEELRGLRARSEELESQLDGLRMYGDVATLGPDGVPSMVGDGLAWDSPLSQALEGPIEVSLLGRDGQREVRCGQPALDKLTAAIEIEPSFPLAIWMLARCMHGNGDGAWVGHAERALEILAHTTEIAGHHPAHEVAQQDLLKLLGAR